MLSARCDSAAKDGLLIALTDSRRCRKRLELWRLLGLGSGLCAAWVCVVGDLWTLWYWLCVEVHLGLQLRWRKGIQDRCGYGRIVQSV